VITNFKYKLNNFYNKIASQSNPTIYVLMFNIKAFILGFSVRIKKDKDDMYVAIDNGLKRFFNIKFQNATSYECGLERRALDMGNSYMLNLLKFNDGDTIIDCGANVGDLMLYFNKQSIYINYIGFEPSLPEFKCLKRNVNSEYLYNIGLWNKKCTLQFFSSTSHADSSFIEPAKYESVYRINADRLDNIISSAQKIKLLKLEAEGAELEVLMGSWNILKNIEYISADLGFERGVNQETTFNEVTNMLLKNNFELVEVGFTRIVALYRNTAFKI